MTSPSPPSSTAWNEARLLINLAIPTVIVQLGATIPPAMTASHIGRHLGALYLDGFTLASLTGNLLTLSLLQGLYSASDTLSPQAFGAGNYKEVGLLAIRGFAGSLLMIVPINIVLMLYMEQFLVWVGEDESTALLASRWYRIYVFALPFYVLYNITWKFLSAQEIMAPLVIVLAVACGVILPVSLNILVPWMGFLGSAVAILVYQASQALLLLAYLIFRCPHNPMTWPGWHLWREALALKPFIAFMKLGAGGMLASSEWWYWEVLSLGVGTLGVVPLSVHTVPTQVLTVSFMIPLGIGVALSVRLGSTLPKSVIRAKQLAIGCFMASTALFGCMAIVMYIERQRIFRIFTTEQQVIDGCERIWWKVVVYFFNLAVFGVNMGIATGLGMQWTLGIVTAIFLWIIGLPAVYYFALFRGGGLDVAWTWIYPPYIVMNAVLVFTFFSADWDAIGSAIRKREGMEDGDIESVIQHVSPDYGSMVERKQLLLDVNEEKKNESFQ